MEDGEEEDGDEDAQLVDGDDHAGGAVLDRPVITAQTAAQEARMKPSSPRGTAQTSRSFPVTATIAQAITAARTRADRILATHHHQIDALTAALTQHHQLTGRQTRDLLQNTNHNNHKETPHV